MLTKKDRPRDPLTVEPLPRPGDSGQWMMMDQVVNDVLWLVLPPGLLLVSAIAEWVVWLRQKPTPPGIITGLFVIAVVVSIWRLPRVIRRVRAMQLGVRGEIAVAEALEELRPLGYHVLHDICAKDFNVDHVAIGPGGIFVIETKTISKPTGRIAEIVYDGSTVRVDGRTPDRDPIKQVSALADHIEKIIERAGAERPCAKPVVLYPGWWVQEGPPGCEVWVLNPARFLGYVRHQPERLAPDEVSRYATILKDHVRARSSG